MVAGMIFGNEYTNHTMKNSISYGIPRGMVYFGKLIVEVIYSIIAFVIIVGIDVASAYLLLENSGNQFFELFLRAILVSLPLFLYAVGVTNCFYFLIEGAGAAISAVTGLLVVVPLVCQLAGHRYEFIAKISQFLPWNLINNIGTDDKFNLVLPWAGNTGYYNFWIAGIVQMVLFVVIGYVVFRKREIK
jgi:ABC-type transport system involved in multi-copper enzyme maturation permease subunit